MSLVQKVCTNILNLRKMREPMGADLTLSMVFEVIFSPGILLTLTLHGFCKFLLLFGLSFFLNSDSYEHCCRHARHRVACPNWPLKSGAKLLTLIFNHYGFFSDFAVHFLMFTSPLGSLFLRL